MKKLKRSKCCVEEVCMNPLCVQNHNLIAAILDVYMRDEVHKMTSYEFMALQYAVWKKVRKEMEI